MTSNLKVLTLTAFAVAALSAVAASAAQAVEFHKPPEAVKLTTTPDGTGTTAHQVFDAAGASITCPGVTAEGTVAGTATTVATVETSLVEYTGECKFLGQKAIVEMHGCGYKFHANGEVDIVCPGPNQIRFSVPSPFCEVLVPAQTGKTNVGYTNINTKTEVTVSPVVTGIRYTATGMGCPITGTQTNGQYTTGNVILTAEKDNANKEMVPIFVE
jgi:hypothetical protein